MTGFDPKTLKFYAVEAPVYTASGKHGVSRHLPEFADRLSSGAQILELGCGGGIDAEYLVGRGFIVEATDGVPEIAAKAAERLERPVRVMRFDEIDAVAAFDAVVASASLLHVPRHALTAILAKIYCALRPGGWHLATFKGGGHEGRDQLGRYFNYLSVSAARDYYNRAAPWSFVEIEEGFGGGYDGVQGPWIKVIARA